MEDTVEVFDFPDCGRWLGELTGSVELGDLAVITVFSVVTMVTIIVSGGCDTVATGNHLL